MKYCTHCGTELNDDAVFCTNCGKAVGNSSNSEPKIKYCTNCGSELKEGADYCLNCGCKVEKPFVEDNSDKNKTIEMVAKVFMVLSCASLAVCAVILAISAIIMANAANILSPEELQDAFAGASVPPEEGLSILTICCAFLAIVALIPLAWSIPLTVIVFKRTKEGAPISIAMKVCILIFVNVVSGILLLCRKEPLNS